MPRVAARVSGHPGCRFRRGRAALLRGLVALVALAALGTASRPCPGQALSPGGPIDFGTVATGTPSAVFALTFTASVPTTIQAITAVTDGSPGLDFAVASQTCTGLQTPPDTCQINLQFTPSAPGLRRGALLVTDSSGAVVNGVFLRGTGLAPQLVFDPPAASALTTVALTPSAFQASAVVRDGAGDLLFNDIANSRILELTPAGSASVFATVPSSLGSSLAISGEGTLFLSQPTLGIVLAFAPGSSTGVPVSTGSIALHQPTGLAVDGMGFLYIVDAANGSLVRVAADGSTSVALTLAGLATPLNNPHGLAVDGKYLYIADTGNSRIVRMPLLSGATAVVATGSLSLSAPTGVAADAAGTVLVANAGASDVIALPTSGSPYVLGVASATLSTPVNLATLPSGDIAVADSTQGLVTLARSRAALNFATPTQAGQLDAADGYQSVTVINTGSQAFQPNAGTPTFSSGAYAAGPAGTCPVSPSSQLAAGATCTYAVGFTPTVNGPIPATMTIGGTGAGGGSSATAAVSLTGTGLSDLTGLSIDLALSSTEIGQPVAFSVRALHYGSPDQDFTGTVTFTSTDPKAVFLSGTSYTFTAADAGVHVFPFASGVQFNTLGRFTISVAGLSFHATSAPILIVAPIRIGLTATPTPALVYQPVTLTFVYAGSNGVPTGVVSFLDGTTTLGTATLDGIGNATLTTKFATTGAHSLTVNFPGDTSYSPGTSPVTVVNVEDFSITSSSSNTATVTPGSPVTYTFSLAPVGGPTMAGPVTLSVSGLPAKATVVWSPTSLPPGAGTTSVTLTVTPPVQTAQARESHGGTALLATFLVFLLPAARSRRRLGSLLLVLLMAAATAGLSGCLGTSGTGYYYDSPQSYNLVVTGTSGSLSHSAGVSLDVQ